MNISGVRPYDGFYQYNSIKLNELRSRQIAASQQKAEQPKIAAAQDAQEQNDRRREETAAFASNQTFSSYDYAQQYRADESYSLKGVDSDLSNLDMEKALSDLDKDQVLQQYQYFVGDDALVSVRPKDATEAIWRSGENFML